MNVVTTQATQSSKTQSVAILVRKREDEELLKRGLPAGSTRLDRNLRSWVSGPRVYYGTYHSAKGLEFDQVILPFCNDNYLPDPDEVEVFGAEDAEVRDARLVYVGVTRAKTSLVITYTDTLSNLFPKDWSLYQRLNR